ncbi:hypothetical protein [Pseudomonas mandelii]|uniref:hypothetical protein n=1 Tax=Pseudomonas mandelii TaxID=75612 RepID=UPI00209ECB02|nr:hypothetical protein [Pseudomonas mandelii]MCO8310322.1 hypothetical protein [Pseudomonas mandelii]
MEVRVFFWAPIQIQGYDLEFHKNPRKRVFAFLAFEKTHEHLSTASVGAAEGCDLLIFSDSIAPTIKIKKSQPSAAPTGDH